jgi:hypothetical protein
VSSYYVQPTIFVDVKPRMSIWREEIFGPVCVGAAAACFHAQPVSARATGVLLSTTGPPPGPSPVCRGPCCLGPVRVPLALVLFAHFPHPGPACVSREPLCANVLWVFFAHVVFMLGEGAVCAAVQHRG